MKRYLVLLLIVVTLFAEDEFSEFEDFEQATSSEIVPDPFSGYNRVMTNFNDGFYMNILSPISTGYVAITHAKVRRSIDNFFNNLYFPMRFVNNILQGKFHNAFEETGRFVVNTTAGFFGFFDLAKSEMKLIEHNEDFGQTLGFYGVGAGPHIVLPILGPSNLRDIVSIYPNTVTSFSTLAEDSWGVYLTSTTIEQVNAYSDKTQYEKIKENAIDLYPYLRDLYEQKRKREVEE
jgi:phospholipid-binding lipoprotein MlaA